MKFRPPNFLTTLSLVILAIVWGSSFILMKRGMMAPDQSPVFAPDQVAALRLALAGLLLVPISIRHFRTIQMTDIKWVLVVAFFGSVLPAFLFTYAQMHIASSTAGILNSLTPLFTLLVGLGFFQSAIRKEQMTGVLIGLAGAIGLIALGSDNSGEFSALWTGLVILASASYGVSVNTIHHKLKHMPPLHLASFAMGAAAIPCSLFLWLQGNITAPLDHPYGWSSLGYILLLAIGGTALANILFFWLTGKTSAVFASSVTYLIPLVAVGWGVADGERVSTAQVGCGLVILAGVWLVRRSR